MKKEIIDYSKSIDVSYIGFCDIEFSKSFSDRHEIQKNKGRLCGLEEQDLKKRVDVKALLDGAKSIIAIALDYKMDDVDKHVPYISRHAVGDDYHKVVQDKLQMIGDFIKQRYGANWAAFCDTGVLHDREIAYMAGIGFYGKNSNIINPQSGSYMFLGELVTDIYIEPDSPMPQMCGECRRCMDACPAGAIEEPFSINANRCLSYITQKKGMLSLDEIKSCGLRVYGCDTCQDVCPYNKKSPKTSIMEFKSHGLDLMDLPNMSNKEFKATFGRTSCGWRGKKTILRNLINAMGNSFDSKYIPVLESIRKNSDNDQILYYVEVALEKIKSKLNQE